MTAEQELEDLKKQTADFIENAIHTVELMTCIQQHAEYELQIIYEYLKIMYPDVFEDVSNLVRENKVLNDTGEVIKSETIKKFMRNV